MYMYTRKWGGKVTCEPRAPFRRVSGALRPRQYATL